MSGSYVTREKQHQLQQRMLRAGLREEDLVEKFVMGAGSGGQKLNKTSSCVYIKHEPSGLEVKLQRTRSRELNRYLARVELCEKTEEQVLGERSRRRMEAEKIRRQKRRRSRRQQQRMLEAKHEHSEKKQRRTTVRPGQD